jgi:hypothetical protein
LPGTLSAKRVLSTTPERPFHRAKPRFFDA